jgi:hypothetical protein
MKIKIENDLFEISSRLKQIDSTYFVVYNTKKHRYEVYSTMQGKGNMCFALGESLNYYAIIKAHKTSIKRLKRVVNLLDIHNEKIIRKNKDETSYKIRTNLKNCFDYISKTGKEDLTNINKTVWR